ncbi:MAG TPA: acyl-CoA thioesterase [Bdellovibrionales bacterium]|nr:acyl-CoA thioesterase [Bdellovibrionales bacterium]
MTEMVLPQHTNSFGNVFGGQVMAWVDIAAAIAAQRHARKPVVTASVDALQFVKPVLRGWTIMLRASVNYTSKRSMEIGVRVDSENPMTGETFHTASAYLTFVALDDEMKPTAVPQVTPETEEEKRRFKAAEIRRQHRLALRKIPNP